MPATPQKTKKKGGRRTVRLSVTLPLGVHDELERMAEKQDVSLAWVLRKAAEQYVENQNPLFSAHQTQNSENEWS